MRLTNKDEQGNWCLKGVKWEQLHMGTPMTRETYEKLYGALWKLMEYEDTGLTPEEIMDGKMLTGWIPVEERLPEIGEPALITLWNGKVTVGTRYSHRWGTALRYSEDVIAWMPLPEPYRPE